MSALANRDTNARLNYSPAKGSGHLKTATVGGENKAQELRMHKQLVEQKFAVDSGYGYSYNPGVGLNKLIRIQDIEQDADDDDPYRKNEGQSYVSPSDAIQSPATQKLANFKQRQMNKSTARKPAARTLFARAVSSSSNGFENVEDEAKE